MKLKLILFIFLLSSNGLLAQIKNDEKTIDGIEKLLGNTSAQAIIDKTKQDAINQATSLATTKTKSYLDTLFPTVEVSLSKGLNDDHLVGGILVVSPLSDPKNVLNTTFTQGSIFLHDDRKTVNLGLGHRVLEFDKKLLLGANAFYDHEFPYDHQRASIGLEARSSVGEINANKYWALTKWKKAGISDERALDGQDIEAAIPLPYVNWAKASVRHFKWEGVDGASDLKGNDYSLRAEVPIFRGLSIEAGVRDFDNKKDEHFVRLTYSPKAPVDTLKTPQLVSNEAYTLTSMEDRRYEKVRRENLIVKQKRRTGVNLVAY
jgi:adhesin/invasin